MSLFIFRYLSKEKKKKNKKQKGRTSRSSPRTSPRPPASPRPQRHAPPAPPAPRRRPAPPRKRGPTPREQSRERARRASTESVFLHSFSISGTRRRLCSRRRSSCPRSGGRCRRPCQGRRRSRGPGYRLEGKEKEKERRFFFKVSSCRERTRLRRRRKKKDGGGGELLIPHLVLLALEVHEAEPRRRAVGRGALADRDDGVLRERKEFFFRLSFFSGFLSVGVEVWKGRKALFFFSLSPSLLFAPNLIKLTFRIAMGRTEYPS